ncbi:MAG TPA: FAD-dependent oxidoreductase [Rhizomicrobium sp.]
MRYDACVIGAGADGLAAALTLARAGLKTIVVEKADQPGGRGTFREFHPGFRASFFTDTLPEMPAELFRALAILPAAPSASLALWPDRAHWLHRRRPSPARDLLARAARDCTALRARALRDAEPVARKPLFAHAQLLAPWPEEDRYTAALADLLAREIPEPDAAAHLMAQALEGRAADPFLRGSALHLLAPEDSLVTPGLAEALAAAAREAGAEILCGVEATDIRHAKERVTGLDLSDGTTVEARALLSTLDLKRTFLSLFAWDALSKPVSRRVAAFRMTGSTARLLLALDRPPALEPEALRAPIHLAPDPAAMADAVAAWRTGTVPEHPPITLRVVSASIPSLAPPGAAVLTVTLGAIPSRLFDGAWTHEKRDRLRNATLDAIEAVLPGTRASVLASELLVPPDIEEALGVTDGDLRGGEIAADQMFALRPGFETPAPRTPFTGLYLAGASSATAPFGTGASGLVAAEAMIADLKAGRLK